MTFQKSVFINCPFDNDYVLLLRAKVFTILYLGFEPRLAQTKSSAITRIQQISELIPKCFYSIHDLSRMKAVAKDALPRFNMAYELGLDQGCITYGQGRLRKKVMLVLSADKYLYQQVLSDISGQDIEAHENNPVVLIEVIRNCFSRLDDKRRYQTAQEITRQYLLFTDSLEKLFVSTSQSPGGLDKVQISDYIKFVKDWLRNGVETTG